MGAGADPPHCGPEPAAGSRQRHLQGSSAADSAPAFQISDEEVSGEADPCRSYPHPLCLLQLYTSGSTGKPKGVLHTTAGYMMGAYATFKYVFDYQDNDVYWCTADCGWITGHSYVTFGELGGSGAVHPSLG